MEDLEQWSSEANRVIEISIVQAGKSSPRSLSTFHPEFTYPLFGKEQRIFGFQDLKIAIRFAAHDLRSNVRITYGKKFKPVGDTKATDIVHVLKDFLPPAAFDTPRTFNASIQNDTKAKHFKPPGELIESYTRGNRKFEIWRGVLTDPAIKEMIGRIQIFISFFIEGGTPLNLEDEEWTLGRWRVYFVYEKLPTSPNPNISPYSIVGYSTSYHFMSFYLPYPKPPVQSFTLPLAQPLDISSLPSKARISQFLILPSHQSRSHGTHLYDTMIRLFVSSPTVTEITVEDPSEEFDDLRDYCDFKRLLDNGTFSQITLNSSIAPALTANRPHVRLPRPLLLDLPLLESLRLNNKIAERQFHRLVELYLFSRISRQARKAGVVRLSQRAKAIDNDDRTYYYWRLLLKQRIQHWNSAQILQVELPERLELVEKTAGELVGHYEELLRVMETKRCDDMRRMQNAKKQAVENGADDEEDEDHHVGDEEDEDEDEDGAMTSNAENGTQEESAGIPKRKVGDDVNHAEEALNAKFGIQGTARPKKAKVVVEG